MQHYGVSDVLEKGILWTCAKQYHVCWCPGSLRRQGISNHDIPSQYSYPLLILYRNMYCSFRAELTHGFMDKGSPFLIRTAHVLRSCYPRNWRCNHDILDLPKVAKKWTRIYNVIDYENTCSIATYKLNLKWLIRYNLLNRDQKK